jgi:hypothetical protein
MPDSIGSFRPGPGIEQISRARDVATSRLPDGESPPPIDGVLQLQLPTVLFQPSLDQALIQALSPTIDDRSILQPERFTALIEQAREQLNAAAAENQNAIAQQRLRDADRLLSQASELHDFLNTSRSIIQRA